MASSLARLLASYWAANIAEVKTDAVLRSYFWCVLGTHAVVWLFFIDTRVLRAVTASTEPLCWPFFENCWKFRVQSAAHLGLLTTGYMALPLLAAMSWHARRVGLAWAFVASSNVLLIALLSLDYRLRANEFYMLLWLNLAYLFWPRKRWAVPIIVVSFYFWAGTLKLNREWISGAALYKPLWLIPEHVAWMACGYVVVLETILVFGLLSSRRWIRLLTIAQLERCFICSR